jgi:D-inositol-3-phosphate glycosyltransferase
MRIRKEMGRGKPGNYIASQAGSIFSKSSFSVESRKSSTVAILSGGGDKPYALGLAASLLEQGVSFDFIGSNDLEDSPLWEEPGVRFLNLRGDMRPNVRTAQKIMRMLTYYCHLLRYAATAQPKVFHILWNNKLEVFDRTLLLLYYRFLGKRLAFTVHNVNAGQRDGNDTLLNRFTLRSQYHMCDYLFVHTEQMRRELKFEFGLPSTRISVIPFGINSTVPDTTLTSIQARKHLGLSSADKVILFFGNIAPYKGLEYLIEATALLSQTRPDYRLIIAGRPKNCPSYWETIQQQISSTGLGSKVVQRIEYVADADTEIYFKAADLLVLPYTNIFQSGVLFLGYNFGLPVVASDVGSLREDIVDGKTGFMCKPRDGADLAKSIRRYFESDLYRQLEVRRREIKDFAEEKYSWAKVAKITKTVYSSLLARRNS